MNAFVRQGFADLVRARTAATLAWTASFAAALAVEVALRTAALDVARLGSLGNLFHALLAVLFGASVGSLLLDSARALALTAYAHPGQPFLARAFARVPALITVTAVELTVEGFLVMGLWLALLPHLGRPRSAAFLAAPALFLLMGMFVAARVALVLAARGLPPARALVHGFDVLLRRLPSLVRLGGALFVYTLPLTGMALMLGLAAAFAPQGLAAVVGRSLALALVELAALVSYAALANLVGRDPRLTTG